MTKIVSFYQETIRNELARMGYIGKYDPRHIEAFMRLQYGCLDHLSIETFRDEIRIGIGCIEEGGLETAESCAQSFGL